MKFGRIKRNDLLSNSHLLVTRYLLKIANSSIQVLKIVYGNFCFLYKFLFKSQNKAPLVLKRPLRSVFYDSTFNLIFSFLENFGILSPNRVISANQGFRHFLIVIGFYFLGIYMFCSRQKQITLLSIKLQSFSQTFLWRIPVYLLVNLENPS